MGNWAQNGKWVLTSAGRIGRIRAVSSSRPRMPESDEQREIRKSVIMVKDTGSSMRLSGKEWLYRAMQETNSEQNAIAMIAASSVANLLLRPIVMCHTGYMGTLGEIGDIIRLFPLSRCMVQSMINDQRTMMIVSTARRRIT